jgi:hypothetical protein
MRIAFAFLAHFVEAVSGTALHAPSFVQDVMLSEETLDTYFDADVADAGVVGGEVCLKRTANGLPTIEIAYWHPGMPSDRLVDCLRAYTVAQLADGIGEGGFPVVFSGMHFLVMADTADAGTVEVQDDGRVISEPPGIAIAAREGDLPRLVAELEAARSHIDRLHQGCTALHLAILYGHPEAIPLLLAAGANPNGLDSQGNTPLETCALTNCLDDEKSRNIAQLLLEAGATPCHHDPIGETARTYAESRQKRLLASIL